MVTMHELLQELEQETHSTRRVLERIPEDRLGWKLMAIPRVALLRAVLLNHWYHHRGQLTVYLRLVGARVPATYGASADENPMARASS